MLEEGCEGGIQKPNGGDKNMKYCLIAGDAPKEDEQLVMSGLFAWKYAFDRCGGSGEYTTNLSREFLEDYDYIHINYVPATASLITAVRDAIGESDTKIVVNTDHGIGMMDGAYDPFIMKKVMADADRIFCTEGYMTRRMETFLERKVWHIPHPCDVDTIEANFKRPSPEAYVISCQHHRYMNTWATYFFATRKVKKEYDASVVLMNYVKTAGNVRLETMFDDVMPRVKYTDYIEALSKVFANMDTTLDYTYGRGVVDAAALGVPTVGGDSIEAMRVLFPDLACRNVDDRAMEEKLEKLATDPDFASEVSNRASERVKVYGFRRSIEKWTEMIG